MTDTITLIRNAATIIAWDGAAQRHVYLRDADLAFRGGTILHVGPGYAGPTTTTIDGRGRLLMPGLVDLHCHPFCEPLNKGMWDEIGSPLLYNTSLYEYLTVLEPDAAGIRACYQVALAELLMSGVTTVCDLSPPSEGWLDILGDSGIRACVAPLFRSGRWSTPNGHRVVYDWDPAAGRRGLDTALAEIARAAQHPSGRLFGMVSPSQVDTCTEDLLRDASAAARAHGLSFTIHAAQSLAEFQEMTRRHGLTPIQWLDRIGCLGPRSIIGHGIFLDDHPSTRWHTETDLKRLAETGTTVAHCPTVFARRGIAMKDLGRYMRNGVNMGIGTDTYPHNMLEELRHAGIYARVMSETPRTLQTTDVFNAATIGGAKALGRDDIGRLAVGCKADFSLVDIAHPMIRPAYDPVRSLIYAAGDRALKAVFVDGNKVVEDGEVLTIDYRQAAEHLHEAQKRVAANVPKNDWAHRSAPKIAPPTFHWS